MTVYEFANKCMNDEEFNRGGIVSNERECIDEIGFEYTMKDGCIYNTGKDLEEFYTAMEILKRLNSKYSK